MKTVTGKRKKVSKDPAKEQEDEKATPRKKNKQLNFCFKNKEHQTVPFTNQVKAWKNIKHMAALEKSAYESSQPTHANISAPFSTKPVKLYSDLSGLPALYRDPKTKLLYSNKEEYQALLHLSPDVVLGLLSLRKSA